MVKLKSCFPKDIFFTYIQGLLFFAKIEDNPSFLRNNVFPSQEAVQKGGCFLPQCCCKVHRTSWLDSLTGSQVLSILIVMLMKNCEPTILSDLCVWLAAGTGLPWGTLHEGDVSCKAEGSEVSVAGSQEWGMCFFSHEHDVIPAVVLYSPSFIHLCSRAHWSGTRTVDCQENEILSK